MVVRLLLVLLALHMPQGSLLEKDSAIPTNEANNSNKHSIGVWEECVAKVEVLRCWASVGRS